MIWLIVIAIAFIALLLAAQKFKRQGPTFCYKKKSTLFSAAERSFLGVLNSAIGSEFSIYGKVRVADVLDVDTTRNRGGFMPAFNKINAKHFDYIVCQKDDLTILCAIELDDKSHNQRSRQDRDAFMESACESAQLALLRFEAKRSYSIQEVRDKIMLAIGVQKAPLNTQKLELTQEQEVQVETVATQPTTPTCPKCGASMIKKQAKFGPHAGKFFWACSSYPKCKCIQEIGA